MNSLLATIRNFPDFAALPDAAGDDLVQRSRVLPVPSNKVVAVQGSPCEFFPLVLSGRARIYAMDEDGREITLYRIGPGDGCVLSAACSVSDAPLPGFVTVEVGGEALFIPAEVFRSWVEEHRFWRDYVFTLVARQLGQVVAVTNDLAFRRLDARIAAFLLNSLENDGEAVRVTHHAVAMEVGTRREVASRILKDLELDGILELGRAVVRVRDRRALAERAAHAAGRL